MPKTYPLAASGSREPTARPKPIPKNVRAAIAYMIYGRLDDENCAPLDLIEAAREANMAPVTLRRWLDRAHIRAHLLRERRAFLDELLASNPGALARVRSTSKNGMCVVAAVRQIEEMAGADEATKRNGPQSQPGVTIRIINQVLAPPPMRDVSPSAVVEIEATQ